MEQEQLDKGIARAEKPKLFLPWIWPPFMTAFAGLLVAWLAMVPWTSDAVAIAGFGLFGIGTLYFLVQMIGRFILRQWQAGFCALARLVACLVSFASVFVLIAADALERG